MAFSPNSVWSSPVSATSSLHLTTMWNPWIVGSRSGYQKPFSSPLPESYLPTKAIRFAADFHQARLANITSMNLAAEALLGWSIAGATVAPAISMGANLVLSYRRRGNSGNINNRPLNDFGPSPRYGYSVGNLFKHQAYFAMDIVGIGYTLYYYVIWYATPGVMWIEACSNSRLRRVYLSQGKILGIYFKEGKPTSGLPPGSANPLGSPGQTNKMMILKIHDKDIPPPNIQNPGKIKIYTMKGETPSTEDLDIKFINPAWEAVIELKADTFVREGDFFTFETPIVVEDPATLHEFGLIDDGGILRTQQQRYEISNSVQSGTGDIIGYWVLEEDPDLGWLYTAYTDYEKDVILPSTESEALRNKESMKFGGGMGAGLSALKNSKTTAIRLIMRVSGSPGVQNFCAGNLVGEFVEINGLHYEIVGQPRGDTITIYTLAMEDKSSYFDNSGNSLKILQQKFWLTSEQFMGMGPAGGGAIGIWTNGTNEATASYDKSSQTTHISWTAIPPLERGAVFNLTRDEVTKWGVNTLIDRHSLDVGAGSCTVGYKKFERWRVLDGGTGRSYRIKDLGDMPSLTDGKFEFSATVYGGDDEAFKGGWHSIVYDEPYQGARGKAAGAGNFHAYAEFAPALAPLEGWLLVMMGYYDGGVFTFPDGIGKESQFSIVSNARTVDNATPKAGYSTGFGNPFVYVSTQRGLPEAIAYLEDPLSESPFVFYNDPDYDYICYRTSNDPEWTGERRQGLVRLGFSDSKSTGDEFITGVSFSPLTKDSGKTDVYWVMTPSVVYGSKCSYFATKITGVGGVDTPLFRQAGLAKKGGSNGIYLPLEIYPLVTNGNSLNASVYIPVKDESGLTLTAATTAMASSILLGENPVGGGSGGGVKSKEITPTKSLLKSMGGKDAFPIDTGKFGLLFGSYMSGNVLKEKGKPSPVLCMEVSTSHCYEWGRPVVDNPEVVPNGEERVPFILLTDFEFIGSLYASNIGNILAFGWVYEPGEDNFNDITKMSLGVYRVAYQDIEDDVPADLTNDKGEIFAKIRGTTFNDAFGRELASGGGSPNESLNEKFFKIIGNENATDTLLDIDWKLNKDYVAPMWKGNSICLFMHSVKHQGIICLVSENLGESWKIATSDGTTPLVYARGEGGYPALLHQGVFGQIDSHNYLFYIADNSLLCKKIDLTGEGDKIQEGLDKELPVIVAADVQPHKAVATTDKCGRMTCYYLSSLGCISAAQSLSANNNWQTLRNW